MSSVPRHLHSFPTRRSSDLSWSASRHHPERRRDVGLAIIVVLDTPADIEPPGRDLGVNEKFQIAGQPDVRERPDRKSTRLNSSHTVISYAVFCLKKKKQNRA